MLYGSFARGPAFPLDWQTLVFPRIAAGLETILRFWKLFVDNGIFGV